jgi:hypothetical protein
MYGREVLEVDADDMTGATDDGMDRVVGPNGGSTSGVYVEAGPCCKGIPYSP